MQPSGAPEEVISSSALPGAAKELLSPEDLCCARLLQALECKKCKSLAESYALATHLSPGRFLSVQCQGKLNPQSVCVEWYVCLECMKPVTRSWAKEHCRTPKHAKCYERNLQAKEAQVMEAMQPVTSAALPQYHSIVEEEAQQLAEDNITVLEEGTFISDITSAVNISDQAPEKEAWIDVAFQHVPTANILELVASFGVEEEMMLFFAAEHARRGGGVQYLTTRMFKRSPHIAGRVGEDIATYEEARWHFKSFVQYVKLGEKERERHAELTSLLVRDFGNEKFFKVTRPLHFYVLNTFYGRSNKHTMWNSLPIPKARRIGNIGYVGPVGLIRFLFAFGIEVEEISVRTSDGDDMISSNYTREDILVVTIAQSKTIEDWKRTVIASEVCQKVLSRYGNIVLVQAGNWRDGFGANRTKQ